MPDMICPLFDVEPDTALTERLSAEGIIIRHVRPWERTPLEKFIKKHFSQGWVDETSVAFSRTPVSVLVAAEGEKIVGFAAYECTAPAYFGPTGIDPAYRGRGLGKALLLETLLRLKHMGYVYGFIGYPGPIDFYRKSVKCMLLPEDWSNIYSNLIRLREE